MQHLLGAAGLVLFAVFVHVHALNPDCGGQCHKLAYCDFPVGTPYTPPTAGTDARCSCPPGTIDKGENSYSVGLYRQQIEDVGYFPSIVPPPPSRGLDCGTSGWTIRFVTTILASGAMNSSNPSAQVPEFVGYILCPDDPVKGYYLRKVPNGDGSANPLTASPVFEVNCLYEERPDSANVDSLTSALLVDRIPGFVVEPQIYRWELPTTSQPIQIPPTGMTVDTVEFKTSCAESGCWVIKGTLTTGEAFNSYEAFNTFFLPQADISAEHPQGDISYDFNYEAVDWTFVPAKHPCTSVNYAAGDSSIDQVSTCCINNPEVGENGGFVANYRPTERFVSWATDLRCDMKFTTEFGDDVCWKAYNDQTTWGSAQLKCEAAGGYLASIKSADENERLRHLLTLKGIDLAWIGLASRSSEDVLEEITNSGRPNGLYEWMDGTQPTYKNWLHLDREERQGLNSAYEGFENEPNVSVSSYKYYVEDDFYFTVGCTTWSELVGDLGDYSSAELASCGGTDAHGAMESTNGLWLAYPALFGYTEPETSGYVCQFDWTCVPHVIQRPNYAAPKPKPDTCLEVHEEPVSWPTAHANCAAQNGSLVVIKDVEDNFFVRRVAMRAGVESVWLGINDQATAGDWAWPDGSDVTFSAWKDFDYWYFFLFRFRIWANDEAGDALSFGEYLAVGGYDYDYGYGEAQYGFLNVFIDTGVARLQMTLANSTEDFQNAFGLDDNLFRFATYSQDLGKDCATLWTGDAMWWFRDCEQDTQSYVCEVPRDQAAVCHSDLVISDDDPWDVAFPTNYQTFLDVGKFKGLNASPGVVAFSNIDPFFGQFSFEIQLDEVELRTKAGKLSGTVGVEHTVDTYLGLANFRPTGMAVLDTFATQIAIHLEKTSFFSVSTHGTNEYTFLEYVNMRLVSVYTEDADFSGNPTGMSGTGEAIGDDEATDSMVRTDAADNINYLQVTFTLGSQYGVNDDPNDDPFSSGLIPLNSVRVGRGTFLDDVEAAGQMLQTCSVYAAGGDTTLVGLGAYAGKTVKKSDFNLAVEQECAPQSAMCASPESIPDHFVSFNVPLGSEVLDNQASNSLENNIFVSLVVNAIDTVARAAAGTSAPNDGGAPWQMKTTLTASIPIVAGGINIFCDGVTAKTDLKDVANADIIIGTASSDAELTRLRIIEDVASTQMSAVESAEIDTDSIEAALMTLVLKGNSSYFGNGIVNSQGFSMELDDLITIHLMEDGSAGSVNAAGVSTNSKENVVISLLGEAPSDNQDSNGLDTDGYKLNGAFYFSINRATARASLHPTPELLAACPFNPPRPDQTGGMSLETCIIRRDVRERGYPTRPGSSGPTAMELLKDTAVTPDFDGIAAELTALDQQYIGGSKESCTCAIEGATCCEAGFLTGILGANDYARDLAVNHIKAVHKQYALNGRYRRAFWINPGYEWTPTQTAGKSLFSVSQKLYLFALISLDENWSRRRMLLSTVADDAMRSAGGSPGSAKVEFPVSTKSIMASAFDVPTDRVGLYDVAVQLTQAEACMAPVQLQEALRSTFEDYLKGSASPFHTTQVLSMAVDKAGVQCKRRNVRQLLQSFSAATAAVRIMVVFRADGESTINLAAFQDMPGITSIAPDATNSPKIKDDGSYVAVPWDWEDDSSSSSSSSIPLIAGIAGGFGGALIAVAGLVIWMKRRTPDADAATPIQTISITDLKTQLSSEI